MAVIRRKTIFPPDLSAKDQSFKALAEAAAKQAEIRKLCQKPIRDEETLKRLCMYLLLDTDNIAVVEIDKKGKLLQITAVPLCYQHALDDYVYCDAILGKREFHRRAVAIHLRNTDKTTLDDTMEMIERFRDIDFGQQTVYTICRIFDLFSV